MSNEFEEKLRRYKEGNLNSEESAEIECELDKFNALRDFLDKEDEEFLDQLKQPLPISSKEENRFAKGLKRKVNLRIILITAVSVFFIFIGTIILTFLTSNIVTSLFGFDYKELYVRRASMVQLAEILHPQYNSHSSGTSSSLFAQQGVDVTLDNTVGNTTINKTTLRVHYSLGKPVPSKDPIEGLRLLMTQPTASLNDHEANSISGFRVLEKAPQGTKAQIFVEFSSLLTPEQLKEQLIDQINTTDNTDLDITPVLTISSRLIMANPSYFSFTPSYPYDSTSINQRESMAPRQSLYDSMDNQAHKESLIGNLNLIKDNQKLLQTVYGENILYEINMDDVIKQVEDKGVQYNGMYISGDREALLKLKGNPLIHCMQVQNIVLW